MNNYYSLLLVWMCVVMKFLGLNKLWYWLCIWTLGFICVFFNMICFVDRTTSRLSKKDNIRGKKAETIRPLISSYDRQWLTPLLGEGRNGVTYEPIHVPSLFASNQKDITQIKLSLLTFTTLFNHYFATATHYFSLFWSTSSTLKFWFIAGLDVLWWNFWVWINFENGCAYPHEFFCVFSNMMCFMDEHAL